jgi:hypothetical protein
VPGPGEDRLTKIALAKTALVKIVLVKIQVVELKTFCIAKQIRPYDGIWESESEKANCA